MSRLQLLRELLETPWSPLSDETLSERAYYHRAAAHSWEEIWEAGPYYDRVSELLEKAERYAIFVGWQIDSRLRMNSGKSSFGKSQTTHTLKEKVIRKCESNEQFQIFFLFWDHSTLYVFEREIGQGRIWDSIHPRVHFVFDNRHLYGASHHEKICIFDGDVALCGGIDLCDARWDTPDHFYFDSRRSLEKKEEQFGPYHDVAVQVQGPAVSQIQAHVRRRWAAISSRPFPREVDQTPDFSPGFNHDLEKRVYLSRTIADTTGRSPVVREVEFLFRDLIASAQSRIIIEGQYYWSKVIHDLLVTKIHQMRGKPFELILILANLKVIKSFSRHMVSYEYRLLEELCRAAEYSNIKLRLGSPYVYPPVSRPHLPPKPVYIHSKVLVIDDRFMGIGSANFATRALRIDTEMHLTLEAKSLADRLHIEQFAQRILDHWGMNSEAPTSPYLRLFRPCVERRHLRPEMERSQSLPLGPLFDPDLPWFYRLKTFYLRKRRRRPSVVLLEGMLIWAACTVSATFIAGARSWGALPCCALLCVVWIFPIPFMAVSGFFLFLLGPDLTARCGVASLWVSAMVGYFLGRIFPDAPRGRGECRGADRLKNRTFEDLIWVLLDPRISVHSKILHQGLYYLPFPWFVLGTEIILAAAYSTGVQWLGGWLYQKTQMRVLLIVTCVAWVGVSVGRVINRVWKNTDSE